MTGRVGVISFPGSNGDTDALYALRDDVGVETRLVDYRETDLSEFTALVLPGGFSYGDHLRCGAIARFSPVMDEVRRFADEGRPVLGICNGFQVLTEAGLLPGALLRNRTLRFHCQWAKIRFEGQPTAWTRNIPEGTIHRLPVAHGEGSYFVEPVTLAEIERNGQVVARYCDALGDISHEANKNGSVAGIAAVANLRGNVVGLMPHPERATNRLIGGTDGLNLLRSVLEATSPRVLIAS